MATYRTIKYLQLDVKATKIEGVKQVKWYTIKAPNSYVRDFGVGDVMLMEMSMSVRWVLDYAVSQMDDQNYVANDARFKRDLKFRLKEAKRKMGNNTINKAFLTLKENGIVKKTTSRGLYMVNPIFYCKATMGERDKLIRRAMEYSHKDVIEDYRIKNKTKF